MARKMSCATRRTTALTRGLPAGDVDAGDAVEQRLHVGVVDEGFGHLGFLRLFGRAGRFRLAGAVAPWAYPRSPPDTGRVTPVT